LAKKNKTAEQKVIDFIREQNLISAGDRVVVAVSGGADSVCLLHVLANYKEELGIDLHVAHLNHRLRGRESEADAEYVSKLAKRLGLAATIDWRDVTAYRDKKGGSLEEAGREVRYGFLSDVAAKQGTNKVAVGHTYDDRVETVLLHLLRGSGTAGLVGLRPRSILVCGQNGGQLEVVRPLLEITRQETVSYCLRHRLAPRSDSSNESPSFLRNRVRLELLPVLRSYNAGIDEALVRLAEIAADDVSFIEQHVSLLWPKVAREQGGTLYLDMNKLRACSPAIQRQLFRRAVKQLRGDLKDIEADHIETMVKALSKPAGKKIYLPDGLTLHTEYENLVLTPTRTSVCPLPYIQHTASINIPGCTDLSEWRIRAEVVSKSVGRDNGLTASFDMDKAGKELKVRRRRPGDRFQPLGMHQTKKLQDFMVDAKIPQSWRDRVPLVSSEKQILWVVGWRIDERVKVTDKTKNVLRLQFERLL
jgi:tRNA(Ile)-lysidine synthase